MASNPVDSQDPIRDDLTKEEAYVAENAKAKKAMMSRATPSDGEYQQYLRVPSSTRPAHQVHGNDYPSGEYPKKKIMSKKSIELERLLGREDQDSVRTFRFPTGSSRHTEDIDDDGEHELDIGLGQKKTRRHRRRRSGSITGGNLMRYRNLLGYNRPPPNCHASDWTDMLQLTNFQENYIEGPKSEQQCQKSESALAGYSPQLHQQGLLFHQMRFAGSNLSLNKNNWISQTFYKRECSRFIATTSNPEKCGCGLMKVNHPFYGQEKVDDDGQKTRKERRWNIRSNTVLQQTDAFGQIEFQGGPHPYKAQYVRLTFDTDPAQIMDLFENVWEIAPPKLIITVHGGTNNFNLQSKLARVFRKGLLKAAMTTGAWIITSGIDTGVVRHVAAAWEGAGSSSRSKVVCIGISPWGLIRGKEELIGQDKVVNYFPYATKGRFTTLNNRHSYFLLVDNGTSGRYGAEVILRKRLETYIAQKQKIFGGTRSVPVVCVILEGGCCTIRSVLDYVTSNPPVPVVICDGSGRASDILSYAHQESKDDGNVSENVHRQLVDLVSRTFSIESTAAQRLVDDIKKCIKTKNLLTVFRLGENTRHDVDHAILTALLKGQKLSSADQLSLALAWNRVDIARSDIFTQGAQWHESSLFNAMMEALIHDRVDFVRLLLENGVSMTKFLTIGRLEDLYNTDKGPPNTLRHIIKDVVKFKSGYQYKLPHIGLAMEKLIGNAFKSYYNTPEFQKEYKVFYDNHKGRSKLANTVLSAVSGRSRGGSGLSRQATEPILLGNFTNSTSDTHNLSENMMAVPSGNKALNNHLLWRSNLRRDFPSNPMPMHPPQLAEIPDQMDDFHDEENSPISSERKDKKQFQFRYPYSELLVWAVLTKRQEMAMCMWEHGEEAMAKALIACKLYKSLSKEAAEDYLEVEVCDELRKYAEEFQALTIELLDHCYNQDDTQTIQLLTYELKSWGKQTCLSLAVIVNNKQFLAHPCCQVLLADLWHGGLRIRSQSNLKVLSGLIFFPIILQLEFKSRQELLNQPQRAVEHQHDIADTSSSSSSADESTDSSDSDTDAETDKAKKGSMRKLSHESESNLTSISRRKPRKGDDTDSCPEIKAENGEAGSYGTFDGHVSAFSQPSVVRKRLQSQKEQKVSTIAGFKKSLARSTGSLRSSKTGTQSQTSDRGKRTLSLGPVIPRMKEIKYRRKLYEFYAAPITTFWAWAISFLIFLCTFTFVLLVRTPVKASWVEWFLFAYVFAFGCEYLRKFIILEMGSWSQKLWYFFAHFWNCITVSAIVTFFIGFGLRLVHHAEMRAYGRVILACNSVLWSMKLLDYMSVHPKLGPYITMAGKMVQNMVYIIVMLVVSLLGFGLARQSITYPNEDWHWILLRNIFYKPYFMLYGEVYADEIDTCGDEAWDAHFEDGLPLSLTNNGTARLSCVPGHWIPPILMTFFLLIANILLMSMLIAIFNHIFDATTEIAQQIWLFQRYFQVMEYESTPVLPPPLTPFSHIKALGEYIYGRFCCGKTGDVDTLRQKHDYQLKLFLTEDQVEKLHDFEEECMDDLARDKEHKKRTSNEDRIYRTAERAETILSRVNELQVKQAITRDILTEFDGRLRDIEDGQVEILQLLRALTVQRKPSPVPVPVPVDCSTNITLNLPGEEEERKEDIAPMPVCRRQRMATFCGTGNNSTDEGMTSPVSSSIFRQRFGSRASMDSSARRARREYRSIADSLDVDFQPIKRSISIEPTSPNRSELEDEEDDGLILRKKSETPGTRQYKQIAETMIDRDEEDQVDPEAEMTNYEGMTEEDNTDEEHDVSPVNESRTAVMFSVVNEVDEERPRLTKSRSTPSSPVFPPL